MTPLLLGDGGFSAEVQETQHPSNFIKITFLSHNQNQIINLTHDQINLGYMVTRGNQS